MKLLGMIVAGGFGRVKEKLVAAVEGELISLTQPGQFFDGHVHLEGGPYTLEWLDRFLAAAERAGVAELGLVEHLYLFPESHHLLTNDYVREKAFAPPPRGRRHAGDPADGGGVRSLERYARFAAEAARSGRPVRCGLEVDYIPGKEAELSRLLGGLPLDFVIGSLHWLDDWGFDLSAAAWDGRWVADVYRRYYATLSEAAASGLFDVIGHPGNIGYFGHRPDAAALAEIEGEFVATLARLASAGRGPCIEFNTGGRLRPAGETFPRPDLLPGLAGTGLPVVLGSDAHRPEDVGYGFAEASTLLAAAGFLSTIRFERRSRIPVPLTMDGLSGSRG